MMMMMMMILVYFKSTTGYDDGDDDNFSLHAYTGILSSHYCYKLTPNKPTYLLNYFED